jgi:hypothetical protein
LLAFRPSWVLIAPDHEIDEDLPVVVRTLLYQFCLEGGDRVFEGACRTDTVSSSSPAIRPVMTHQVMV